MKIHSKEYEDFIYQINAAPRIRYDGYDPDLLESIYPEEREEIESIILKLFEEGDYYLSCFIPKIERVNGVEMLERALKKSNIPSSHSLEISSALYQHTLHKRYLDVIIENLKSQDSYDRQEAIGALAKLNPSEKIYDIFKLTCINDSDEIVRTSAAFGILYCKGYIKDPSSLEALSNSLIDIFSNLNNDDKNVRIEAIRELEQQR